MRGTSLFSYYHDPHNARDNGAVFVSMLPENQAAPILSAIGNIRVLFDAVNSVRTVGLLSSLAKVNFVIFTALYRLTIFLNVQKPHLGPIGAIYCSVPASLCLSLLSFGQIQDAGSLEFVLDTEVPDLG